MMSQSHTVSRRGFLRAGAGLALGLGLARFPSSVSARTVAPTIEIGPDAWAELARGLQGSLLLPGDAGFADQASPWNLRYAAIQPAGIAACASADDVRTSLFWA